MNVHNAQSRRTFVHRPQRTHRSEFPPAIPRRVAPQQSPLPLRRITDYRVQTTLPQFRASIPVSQFPCLNNRVQFIMVSQRN
jgi:hypothetical protein